MLYLMYHVILSYFFSDLSSYAWILGISPLQCVLILSKNDWPAGHPIKCLPISCKVKIQMVYKGLHSHLDMSSTYLPKLVSLGLPCRYPSSFLYMLQFPEEGMLAGCSPVSQQARGWSWLPSPCLNWTCGFLTDFLTFLFNQAELG